CQRFRIDPQRLVRAGGKQAARKHIEASKREPLRTADMRASQSIVIVPGRPRAGIEQKTNDREIRLRTRPRGSIRPEARVRPRRPAIFAANYEMPPARVKRNVERSIAVANSSEHEIDRGVEAAQIDQKMREAFVKPDCQHAMRTLPHCSGGQKRKGIDGV